MLTILVFYLVNTKMPNKKQNVLVLEDLDYADDIGLLSSKHQDAQQKGLLSEINTKMPNKKQDEQNVLVLEDLDYTDDIGLLSSKHQDAQQKAEHLSPRRSRLC